MALRATGIFVDAALVLEYVVVIWAPIDVAKAAVVCVFENESCHLFLTWW